MGILWTITTATFKMLTRNKQSLFFTWFFPLMLMLAIGYLTQGNGGASVAVGMVHSSSNTVATQIVDGLKKVEAMDITTGTQEEELKALSDNKRDLVVVIPDEIGAGGSATIDIYENAGKPQQSGIAQMIVTQAFGEVERQMTQAPHVFVFESKKVDSTERRYIDFLVPGIIAMSIMQLGIFGTAFVIVDAKQKGVLKRVLATPIASWQYVIGNMLARLVLSMSQAAILVAVAHFAFDVQFRHWGWLLLLVILGNAVFLSIGLFISGVAKTVESVPVLGNLIVFPMLLLGGIFFPTTGLPDWLSAIVDRLPVALLADLMRNTVTLDKGFSDVWVSLLSLFVWVVIAVILANTFFRLQEKD